jgi:cytolysin-activating lysine-acyltransferase
MSQKHSKTNSVHQEKNSVHKENTEKNSANIEVSAEKKSAAQQPSEELKKAIRNQEVTHLNLGYIVGLFSNSKYHVKSTIGHFMASVIPAMKHSQFKLFFNGMKPVGFVSWAMLSEEVEKKYKSGKHLLTMDEWKSGDEIWLAEFIVPYAPADREVIIANLKEKVFPNKTINILVRNQDGSVKEIIKNFEQKKV